MNDENDELLEENGVFIVSSAVITVIIVLVLIIFLIAGIQTGLIVV